MKKKILTILIGLFFLPYSNIDAQWTEQYSGDSVIFKSVSAVDDNLAWVCGDIQRVYRTTNGGTNWIRCSNDNIPYPLSLTNIFGIDRNTALVTGTFIDNRTFLFRTTDGGLSWAQVFSQTNGFINCVAMYDSLEGIIQGDPVGGRWSIWKTNDGGANWDSSDMYLPRIDIESGYNNCMHISNLDGVKRIWFGTDNYKVYHSSNNGKNWTSQITPSSHYIYSIFFDRDLSTGMRGGSKTYKTTNYGLNWQLSNNISSSGGITGINEKWWSIDSYVSNIYHSSDNGKVWAGQFNSPETEFVHISISRNYSTEYSIWAVGNPGKIFKYSNTVNILQISNTIPTFFELAQNYPNPFNPNTEINFSIPTEEFVNISIYNSIGKEISKPVNQILRAGSYKLTFKGEVLSSGTYFVVMTTKNYHIAKKMLLLK